MIRPVRAAFRAAMAIALAMTFLVGASTSAHATVYAQIEGTGSTWSELIVQ